MRLLALSLLLVLSFEFTPIRVNQNDIELKEQAFKKDFQAILRETDYNFSPESCSQGPSHKNRYTNILPYSHSHVKLQDDFYINANWMTVADLSKKFIATQGPLPSTEEDFWYMVLKTKAHTILKLCNIIENNRPKCHKYYPDEDKQYNNFTLLFKGSEVLSSSLTRRKYQLVSPEATHSVEHYHYTDWGDFSVPSLSSFYPALLTLYNRIVSNLASGPAVVHCSAGVGRTGTFLAIFSQIYRINSQNFNGDLSIPAQVLNLKKDRFMTVQTEEQYLFIYKTIKLYLQTSKPL